MSKEKKLVDDIIVAFIFLLGLAMAAVAFSFVTSCTYSITMVHTQGTATDVVDEDAKAQADIKPNLVIPLTP